MLDVLTALADHSLVRRLNSDGDPRFSLLETVREYGVDQLNLEGELESARHAHASFVLQLVEHLRPRIEVPEGPDVIQRFDA